jgi:hypothetical protein
MLGATYKTTWLGKPRRSQSKISLVRVLIKLHPFRVVLLMLCCCQILQEEFKIVLDYIGLGFLSMIQMASNLPDVFHCVILDGTNWKLFDARKELPPQYSYDIKSNKIGELYLVL